MPAHVEDKSHQKPEEQRNTLLHLLVLYFKLVGLLLGVWVLGYVGFSASWVFIGLFIYMFNDRFKKKKQFQIEIAQALAKDEKKVIQARVEDLPSWVFFPDVERAEWVNKILEQMWPYIGELTKNILVEKVQPQIIANLPNSLKSFRFVKIDLGDIPPRIGGVKAYIANVKRDEIVIDVDLIYASDADIKISLKGLNAGIKDLQIRGDLRVILRPLIPVPPLIGGVTVFFLTNPRVDFNLTDIANALDIPGLSDTLRSIVQDQIAAFLVLPNRIPISLAENISLSKLKHPMPQGVLRMHVIEAKDLRKADINVFGKGKSDPYAVLHVGALTFKTKVIPNTLSPMWNQFFEAVIDQRSGQILQFEVMDEDQGTEDDFLGRGTVEIESVADRGMLDSWIPLDEVKTGLVHFRLSWLHLSADPSKLAEVRAAPTAGLSAPLSSCLVVVTVDSASGLPKSRKGLEEPNPYAVLNCGGKQVQTRIVEGTIDPRWEESFNFLINDPNLQNLDVEVKDKKSGRRLGTMMLPLKLLLSETNMTQEQPYHLHCDSDPDAQITMRVVLRVLTSETPPDFHETTENLLKPPTPSTSTPTKSEPIESTYDVVDAPIPEEPIKMPEPDAHSNNVDTGMEIRKRKLEKEPSISSAGIAGLGKIQVTIRYSPQRNRLIVVVHKCVNLMPCDSDHLADPYVRIYLLPEKNTLGKQKTKVIKNNLNPIFDETFEFAVNQQDLDTRTLDISVKNSVGMFSKSRRNIGSVFIDLMKFDLSKAVTEWFDLQSEDRDDKSVDSIVPDKDKETII
ncbi:extended synaptotagmin-2-like isoform X2 [Lineus longissimus]|uniref:extended synaptotagmin-2-like isoform X2 n=1 Tax=Lineus longissimus TaxID=88925 RepID=UPI00315CD0CD